MRSHLICLTSLLIVGVLAACSSPPQATLPAVPATEAALVPCELTPIVTPTRPAEVPGYTELDPATGLHMTGTAQAIDLDSYRLIITGTVDHPLALTYDDLRCMRKVELRCTLICPGFFEDEATWAGVPLVDVLERAGMQPGAAGLRLSSADGYSTLVTLPAATSEDNFLAYEWEGEPLPILHGFPVRAVFPELGGSFWVKWLIRIEVLGTNSMSAPDVGNEPGDLDFR
jgi:DMSO/TMAO reductase YedYZ molybdopterin-dependent catalytic subunit